MDYHSADTRLPGEAPEVTRWTAARKDELLRRIRRGELSEPEACARWGFTPEEIAAWRQRSARFGFQGLKATTLQVKRP
jgi:hypothetical protein